MQIIETGCFKELNLFGPGGSRSPDLDWSQAPAIPKVPKRRLLDRIFRRHHVSQRVFNHGSPAHIAHLETGKKHTCR
uniref:Uncharacterized protein n=1 Tax=Acanthochromis polyacanthus TaxID=80966 RepID=A0A3Q1FKZ7_9TELE